ncbi:cytochrome b/b6 domain-containing protein [Xanthobacter sp. VNH20]|uniref:cytochrome b n=1 Tax=Xanthobacter sp. VNH20 TaxID=3156616 RepID=UPI0032B3FD15
MRDLVAQNRYTMMMRSLHWLTVALVLTVYGLTYVVDLFARGTPERGAVWGLHISFGLVLLVVVLWRLVVRAVGPLPAPSAALSRLMYIASHAVHMILYVLLIATPVLGITMTFLRGQSISLFGLLTIASPFTPDRDFARQVLWVHENSANLLMIVAALHALAALYHHFVRKDDVLQRMLFGMGRR